MTTAQDIIGVLSSLTLFADLPRPQLEVVAHSFDEEWFAEGQRVLRQGFGGSSFYVIMDGEANVVVDGRDVATLKRGDFFGEVSILLQEPPSADVIATQALHCLALPGPGLEEFLLTHPKVMFRMLQNEAHRLHSTLRWQS